MAFLDQIFSNLTSLSFVAFVAAVAVLHLIVLSVYRLYFSPVAKFPGPKLAAATGWYETYYDIWKGGQFTFHIERLHDQYGPIIRINPHELSIRDPAFYNVVYSTNLHLDRYPPHLEFGNNMTAGQATGPHNLHRIRRNALNPYFSRRSINAFSPYVQQTCNRVVDRVLTEWKTEDPKTGQRKILSLTEMWTCFAGDIVMEYCFARNDNFVDAPDFLTALGIGMRDSASAVHLFINFPWLSPLLHRLPEKLVGWLKPDVLPIFAFHKGVLDQILEITTGRNQHYKDASHPTIFKELLESDLPPEELSITRLKHEGQTLVGAGIETTKWTLSVACFHIYSNPDVYNRLYEELCKAIPDENHIPPLVELEKLEYLTVVIQEALRISYGVVMRLPRISPNDPIHYSPSPYLPRPTSSSAKSSNKTSPLTPESYTIPPGVAFSVNQYSIHHSPLLYPNADRFIPERWLNNPVAFDGKPLTNYLVPFSKGTRSCLGMQLAYAELYIGLATFIRRVKLELAGTTEEDMRIMRDAFVPQAKATFTGVNAVVVD